MITLIIKLSLLLVIVNCRKPNVGGFSRVSKRSSKMVYNRVLENIAISPGYNRILNTTQSRSITMFFTKHN